MLHAFNAWPSYAGVAEIIQGPTVYSITMFSSLWAAHLLYPMLLVEFADLSAPPPLPLGVSVADVWDP